MTSVLALYLGAEFGLNEQTIGYVFLYVGVLSFVMRSVLLGPDRGPDRRDAGRCGSAPCC